MKKYISLILATLFVTSVKAVDSDWKIHPIFDEEVTHVVETPSYVYFTSRRMMENATNEVYYSLFRFDKQGEELIPLSTSNILNGNTVRDVIYNPSKGYIAVLYKDYNIDFIHNDGSVTNIPFFMQSNISYSKTVNSMAIDSKNDRLYLATDFGYVAINDKKNEIAESRLYGVPFKAYCRVGDKMALIKEDQLLSIDADSPKLSLDQFEEVDSYDNPEFLFPLSESQFLMTGGADNDKYVKIMSFGTDGVEDKEIKLGKIYNIENTTGGIVISTEKNIYQFKPDGSYSTLLRPENYRQSAATTSNMAEVWLGQKRKGLSSMKVNGERWSLSRNWMLPNAPATYVTTSFANHPSKGFLMLDYGYLVPTLSLYSFSPLQLSGYKEGRWTNYAPAYTNSSRSNIMTASNGLAVDPDNSQYVYITSYHNGILRLNLNDPKDILHLARRGDADRNNPGFAELVYVPEKNAGYCNITPPYFDSRGNLWMYFPDWDDPDDPNPNYYCWLADDRRATTSSANLRGPRRVEFPGLIDHSNQALSIPLLKNPNGLHVMASYDAVTKKGILALINTNNTPTDPGDDRTYKFPSFTDSDGDELSVNRIRYIWEDPSTGYVWVCHGEGVFYFIPSQILNGNYQVYRVKVSRNDGTNLADYLLDGVSVNQLTQDSEGRKWFVTSGAGVVCTTPDGREILEEFTTANSPLPDDVVFGVGYNSGDNSLMFSTDQGYAEYLLPVNQETSDKTDIKAYPNPVRPEYSGYVTITDIPSGSFVKITDVHGNLVKDLGIMTGFNILWDLSDANFNRVKSGVYHIMVSPSGESGSFSGVGKILVIS